MQHNNTTDYCTQIKEMLGIYRNGDFLPEVGSSKTMGIAKQPYDFNILPSKGSNIEEDMDISIEDDELQELHDIVIDRS